MTSTTSNELAGGLADRLGEHGIREKGRKTLVYELVYELFCYILGPFRDLIALQHLFCMKHHFCTYRKNASYGGILMSRGMIFNEML